MPENQVKVNQADTVPNWLASKLQGGYGIILTNNGTCLRIDCSGTGPNGTVAVDSQDKNLGFLSSKISGGTGISIANTGSALEISANAQTGDHKVCVDSVDPSPDYLEEKIKAGSNVSITNQGSHLEISSTDTGMLNPMTTKGDLISGGVSGNPTRLQVGNAGEVLTSIGSDVAWTELPGYVKVGSSDTSPDYLGNKLVQGSGITLTNGTNTITITADTQTGDHKVLASNSDTDPAGYLDSKISFSSPLIATGSNNLSVSIDYGQDGQILGTEGTTVKWVDRPEKVCWNINPNQTSSALTRVIDRTYFSQFFGTPGITNPTDIYVRMHEAHTSDQYYVYVFNNSNEMTHYSAFTSPTNTSVFKIPLTKLAATFTPEYYYIAIALHVNAGGQNTRFRSSTFGSSTWYYDGVFSSGDPKPANSSLTTTTTAPCFALVGR